MSLDTNGGQEDGWDAIDHAIAEYDFRPGAVPIFVLLQNQEGRIVNDPQETNTALTREGILAALQSKGVILNTMTIGSDADGLGGTIAVAPPVFDLSKYGLNSEIRVLGVESDVAYKPTEGAPAATDDFLPDGQHRYRWVDTVPSTANFPGATTSHALQ